ncbi:sugar ABC transporter permease, partial [Streptomyces fungicidicus]
PEIVQACEAARIWPTISQLPDGLDTVVGDRGSTRPVVEYLYDMGFTGYRLGYASAISYVFFALVVLASAVQFVALRRREK